MTTGDETPAMHVLLEAYWWQDGPTANRTVQREMITTWSRRFPDDRLTLALRQDADAPGRGEVDADVVRTRLWPQGVSNRLELGRHARRVGADVVVAHNYAARGVRNLVFVHDAMFAEHPEWFSRSERAYFSRMLPWARSASVVATSSRTEAARLERLSPRLAPVVATGLGVPRSLTDAVPRRPQQLPEDVTGFAVTVGRLNVRKNLEAILLAAAAAHSITPATPLLVVGGSAHSGVSTQVPPAAARAIEDGRVRFLGFVDDDELAWLYRNASLSITLSRDEGFGMPAVEAAHVGSPLLVSDIPVFRETVGDYAAFVPLDATTEATAAAIDARWGVPPDPAARDAVVRRCTWESVVERMREALTPSGG